MKLDKVAASGNDEFYTPRYAIWPLVPYLKPERRILCPFDTEESWFVGVLRGEGHEVTARHINTGQDFFDLTTFSVQDFDYIISNPPYSKKTEVLQHLFRLGRPFAMLVGIVGLFESQKRFEMFRDNDFEVMYFNRRIAYYRDYADEKPALNPPFSSVYICSGILPRAMVFEELDRTLG